MLTDVAEFQVYPNPTSSLVNIESESGFENVQEILIYNVSGQVVRKVSVPAKADNIYTINLDDQPSGYYLVKLVGADMLKQYKLILNK